MQTLNIGTVFGPCGCIGPQNGELLCPCQMRGVTVKDGRYVRIQDLGPVRQVSPRTSQEAQALVDKYGSTEMPANQVW